MANGFEPFNRSRFDENGHSQDVSNPWEGEQFGEGFSRESFVSDNLLDPQNLTGDEVNGLLAVSLPIEGTLLTKLNNFDIGVFKNPKAQKGYICPARRD
jgi:hypothetical protein